MSDFLSPAINERLKEKRMESIEKAKRIIDNLNDRSGIEIDFDEDIMDEIYQEVAAVIVERDR